MSEAGSTKGKVSGVFRIWPLVEVQLRRRPHLHQQLAAWVRRPVWPVLWVLLCCVLTIGASYKRGWSQHVAWAGYEAKIANPLTAPTMHQASAHLGNLNLRLAVPVLGHLLGLRRQGLSVLYFVAGVTALLLAFRLIEDQSDRVSASLATLGIAATSVGSQGFIGSPFYDPMATVIGVYCLNRRPLPVLAAAILAALFVDERAVTMLPAILLSQWLRRGGSSDRPLGDAPALLGLTALVCALWLAVRWWLVTEFGLQGPAVSASVGLQALGHTLTAWPLLCLSGFEAAWWIIARQVAAERSSAWLVSVGLAVAVALPVVLSPLVHDISRSMSFALPALLLCYARMAGQSPRVEQRSVFLLVAAINLVSWDVLYYGSFMPAPPVVMHWLMR